jgi:hypothetical protein
MERETYEEACKSAAEEQGIARIVAELSAREITATVWQSGGFCMVAVVDLGDGWNVWANSEGASLVLADGDGSEVDNVAGAHDDIAERIAAYVRQWREGIAEMRATRRRVDDMTKAIPELISNMEPFAGYLYFGAYWVCECDDGTYSVDVANDGMRGSLADCEAYLYGYCVRMNER